MVVQDRFSLFENDFPKKIIYFFCLSNIYSKNKSKKNNNWINYMSID